MGGARAGAVAAKDKSVDDATLLTLVDTQIAALLNGGAVKRWKDGGHEVEHMSLLELYKFKEVLENRIYAASCGMFLPVREVDV